jgi:hypothetical protein
VFYGRAKRDVDGNTYISNYSPTISVTSGTTYTFSFYIKTNTDLTQTFLAYFTYNDGSGGCGSNSKTYTLRANEWTRVEIPVTSSQTRFDTQYGVRLVNVPDNQEFWIAYPKIVEGVKSEYTSQDWSKWSHWNVTYYWTTREQFDDPIFGKVFKGVAGPESNKYLYHYYPYTFISGTTYTMGIWLRGDTQWNGDVRFYVNRASDNGTLPNGEQTKRITIDTNWKYFTWTVTPTETQLRTGGFGIEFRGLPQGYTLYA